MKIRSPLYAAMLVLLTYGCNKTKTDPDCIDASCCGPSNGNNVYVEYVKDVEAAIVGPPTYSGYGITFRDTFPTNRKDYISKYESTGAMVCEYSLVKLKDFPISHYGLTPPDSFPYRVSGKLLDYSGEKLIYAPIFSFYIDKIERIVK